MKLKIKTYSSLTPEEIGLLARLEYEGKEIYAREAIVSFCRGEKNADYLIRRLLAKNRLRTIIRNVYLLIPMKAPKGKWAVNEYVIAKALARGANYYIGYSAVFNSYGFTEQMAQMIHVVNEKYSFLKTIGGTRYKLIKVLPDRIYGVESRRINGEDVVFASRERSLVDAFDFYDTKKAYDILAGQLGRMNMPLLLDHVARYPVQLVRRRMGYFLGRLGVEEALLHKIDAGTKGYSFLYDTEPQKGRTDRRWRVIVNG